MRKLLVTAAAMAVLVLGTIGATSAASKPKPTTTTSATTTTMPQPTGLAGYEVVRATTDTPIQPGAVGQVQPACPPGKVVTGGGWEFNSTPYGENMRVLQHRPYYDGASHFWLVVVKNENDVAVGAAAYAICAEGP